jgi:hypothetical protein
MCAAAYRSLADLPAARGEARAGGGSTVRRARGSEIGGGTTDAADAAGDRVPAATRWFVWSFLTAFLVCATVGIELWPLSGFRLFSSLRHETRTMWVADSVGSDGAETEVFFTDLPRAYQGFGLLMGGFRRLPPSTQLATCEAYLSEVRRVEGPATALRIYSLAWHALPRAGDRPAIPPPRTLVYVCR